MKLPVELKSLRRGLIIIKNNDQKCFLRCYARHINPVKIHPERRYENKLTFQSTFQIKNLKTQWICC